MDARITSTALLMSALLVAGCQPKLFDCDDVIEPKLMVSIKGLTAAADCENVTVMVREGTYEEQAERVGDECVFGAAWDRPGTYAIVVKAPGYGEQHLTNVIVERRPTKDPDCPPEAYERAVDVTLTRK